MNRSELKDKLVQEGIREDAYSLTGGTPDDTYVLSQDGQRWSVYYAERGLRIGERTFNSEADASDELLNRLLKDPTTRRDYKRQLLPFARRK